MLNRNEIGDALSIAGALMLLVGIVSISLCAIVLLFTHGGLVGMMFGIGAVGIVLIGVGHATHE